MLKLVKELQFAKDIYNTESGMIKAAKELQSLKASSPKLRQ